MTTPLQELASDTKRVLTDEELKAYVWSWLVERDKKITGSSATAAARMLVTYGLCHDELLKRHKSKHDLVGFITILIRQFVDEGKLQQHHASFSIVRSIKGE